MSHYHSKTAGPICPKFCTQILLGPEIYFLSGLKLFIINIFWSGGGLEWDWVRRGGEGRVRGREVRGGKGRGEGLLNFHLNFQKTWAEPGNPSYYNIH